LERSLERGRRSPAGTPSANANHPPARIAAGGTPIGQPSGREIEPANDEGKVWGIREEREGGPEGSIQIGQTHKTHLRFVKQLGREGGEARITIEWEK